MLARLLLLGTFLISLHAHAISIPGFPNTDATAKKEETSPVGSIDDQIAQLRIRLDKVTDTLAQQNTTADASGNNVQRYLLELQSNAYRQHIAMLLGQKAQDALSNDFQVKMQIASSVTDLNQQRKTQQVARLEIKNLSSTLQTLAKQVQEMQENLSSSQANVRLKSEALEEKAKPEQRSAALQDLRDAQLNVDVRTATLEATQAREQFTRQLLESGRKQLELLTQTINEAPKSLIFTDPEFQQIQTRTESRRQALSDELIKLSNEKNKIAESTQKIIAELQALEAQATPSVHAGKSKTQARSAEDIAAQKKQLRQQEELNLLQLQSNAIRTGVVLDLLNNYTVENIFWQVVYKMQQQKGEADLLQFSQQASKWDEYLKSQEEDVKLAATVAEMDAKLIDDQSTFAQTKKQIWHDRAVSYRDAQTEIERLRMLISRWSEEYAINNNSQTLTQRIDTWQSKAYDLLTSTWQYELFSVADQIEVDGKTIPITRGVTVSKVAYAILLITIGFYLMLKLASWIEGILIKRLAWSDVSVRIGKRWVVSVAFIILLLNSLLLVRIPLTVFAFMGGAIAIGLGFGMQTLLKNLISGLMMVLERPFKPGDTIAVGGLLGTVVDMSVRAAVIRDVNGIETLVPNSTFLEQNVTNWTYSSSLIRQNVKVGVAYGSDIRLVAKLLNEDVDRHGQICKDPKPEILLEDFGADALMFGVYYWIDINAGTIGRQVASDVRFMIEASLRKHDIAIAFPQRDVHVDIAQPIKVQVSAEAKPEKNQESD